MDPRGHVIISTAAALIARPWRRVSLLTWLASILADADHLLWHTAHSGRVDPAAAYRHFRNNPVQAPARHLPLHRSEVIAALFVLGRSAPPLHDLALGLGFHRAIDELTDLWKVGRRSWTRRQRQRLWAIAFHRAQGVCQHCGDTRPDLELHHRIPENLGGRNHPDNLLALCPPCHARAHHRA